MLVFIFDFSSFLFIWIDDIPIAVSLDCRCIRTLFWFIINNLLFNTKKKWIDRTIFVSYWFCVVFSRFIHLRKRLFPVGFSINKKIKMNLVLDFLSHFEFDRSVVIDRSRLATRDWYEQYNLDGFNSLILRFAWCTDN